MSQSMTPRPRARELGIIIGTLPPGPLNAITDVPEVRVGHCSIVEGSSVRTGVTAVLPHGANTFREKVTAAVHVMNGFGKALGLAQIAETGAIETPISLTNTLSVGAVANALVGYMLKQNPDIGLTTGTVNPVVLECSDAYLNDIRGRRVKPRHVYAAIADARGGSVAEGSVGAGTGMSAFGFKGGFGTASRALGEEYGSYVLGALVLANFGRREDLIIAGVPVGRELAEWQPEPELSGSGSCIVLIATDAPLSSRQLGRVARRAGLGLARVGSQAFHSSGDFVVAFSTTRRKPHYPTGLMLTLPQMAEDGPAINQLFQAAAEATEEALINALLRAQTVAGREGHVRHALPLAELKTIMSRYGRPSRPSAEL